MISSQSYAGAMMDNLVNEQIGLVRTYLVAEPGLTMADAARKASTAMAESADVRVVQISDAAPVSTRYLMYMQFASYTILLSISVCTSIVMSRFRRSEVQRRNALAPVSPLSLNLQVSAACFVIMLVCWAFVSALGLAVFGAGLTGVGAAPIVVSLAALLVYSLFGLGLGFLMGQVTDNEALGLAFDPTAGAFSAGYLANLGMTALFAAALFALALALARR